MQRRLQKRDGKMKEKDSWISLHSFLTFVRGEAHLVVDKVHC